MIRATRDISQNYMIDYQTSKLDAVTHRRLREESVMSDISANLKDGAAPQRELTKLECGLLGALFATIVLGFLFWLGIEFSFLNLIVQIS
jgi:hypothetical protein